MSNLEQSTTPPSVPTTRLNDRDRDQLTKYLSNPLDFPPEFWAAVESRFSDLLTAGNIQGLTSRIGYTGELLWVYKDYTAQTGVFELDAKGGTWLYCNGASISGLGYTDLEAYMGSAVLPDTRGRFPLATGTNANTNLGDNDGQALASREPKHKHTAGSLGISGAPSAGSLAAASGGAHTHTITDPGHFHNVTAVPSVGLNTAGGAGNYPNTQTSIATDTKTTGISINSGGAHTHSITGAPGAGSLGIFGEPGSGVGANDAVVHIALGSVFIHV